MLKMTWQVIKRIHVRIYLKIKELKLIYISWSRRNPKFQEIYLDHIRDVIENKYEGLGKTKKGSIG